MGREKANKWIYPINDLPRDYQISISRTALFNNTMVCLPTGMGKTLIASIVMYNYYRWFPNVTTIYITMINIINVIFNNRVKLYF